jgi:hypothetical protein
MQNWIHHRTQVTRGRLLTALVVGGLLLAACAPAAAPVTRPSGGSPQPTHTAALTAATDPAQATEQFMRAFYAADYHDRDQWLARLMPLASEDGYTLLKNLVAPALWPDLEKAQTIVKAEQITIADRGLKAEGISKMVGNTPWQIRAVTVTLAPEAKWPGLINNAHSTNVLLSQVDGRWQFVMLLSDDQAKAFQTKGAK